MASSIGNGSPQDGQPIRSESSTTHKRFLMVLVEVPLRPNSPAASLHSSPFRALADGTRRRILESLRERERSVNELVEGLDASSQPALSQHLKVLREAGLVTVRRDGRRQMYALDPRPLTEVRDWLAHFDRFWDGKLDALSAFLDEDH